MKITMLSASRANTYKQCSYQYSRFYPSDENEEAARSEADFLNFGTMMHSVFESVHGDELVIGEAIELFNKLFLEDKRVSDAELYAAGLDIINEYYSNSDYFKYPVAIMPDGRFCLELEFYYGLDNKKVYWDLDSANEARNKGVKIFRGFIDKILKIDDDTIKIVDYKTSWVEKSQYEVDNDLQLSSYNMAAREVLPWAKNVYVALNYLRHGDEVESRRTSEDAEVTRSYLSVLFDKIQKDEEPVQKLNTYCSYCPVKHECGEFTKLIGTPYEIRDITDETSHMELLDIRENLQAKKKIVDNELGIVNRTIKGNMEHADALAMDVGDRTILLRSNKRSFYTFESLICEVGLKAATRLASVSKKDVQSLLKGDKEAIRRMDKKAVTRYGEPILDVREAK